MRRLRSNICKRPLAEYLVNEKKVSQAENNSNNQELTDGDPLHSTPQKCYCMESQKDRCWVCLWMDQAAERLTQSLRI
jgi:hypothetical protein